MATIKKMNQNNKNENTMADLITEVENLINDIRKIKDNKNTDEDIKFEYILNKLHHIVTVCLTGENEIKSIKYFLKHIYDRIIAKEFSIGNIQLIDELTIKWFCINLKDEFTYNFIYAGFNIPHEFIHAMLNPYSEHEFNCVLLQKIPVSIKLMNKSLICKIRDYFNFNALRNIPTVGQLPIMNNPMPMSQPAGFNPTFNPPHGINPMPPKNNFNDMSEENKEQ